MIGNRFLLDVPDKLWAKCGTSRFAAQQGDDEANNKDDTRTEHDREIGMEMWARQIEWASQRNPTDDEDARKTTDEGGTTTDVSRASQEKQS